MGTLSGIYPERVFRFFEDICAIPHGSGNTAALADYLESFAVSRSLSHRRDSADNIVIIKDATAGRERLDTIILQGHFDMVCEKSADCALDLEKCGVVPYIENGFVRAKGTTLGADDGIAVAYILAVLNSADIPHPRIEAVFTNDEETGLFGASALDMSALSGKRLINLDSEDEGVFIAGCAGGVRARCEIPVKREDADGTVCTVTIGGCAGGHSGMKILNRGANAIKLMGRFLGGFSGIRILSLSGGGQDNAIPRESTAVLLSREPEMLVRSAEDFCRALRTEFSSTDPDIYVNCVPGADSVSSVIDKESAGRIVSFLRSVPNGVQSMCPDIEGLVQTSLNLGILNSDDNSINAVFAIRSSVKKERGELAGLVAEHCKKSGGNVTFTGEYPAWEYNNNSKLREIMTKIYRESYGKEPKTEVIHAGLECGIFAGKRPDLDCVSLGPNTFGAHTPQERLDIASAGRVWDFLLKVLAGL
ncbi:MAG: aminoacyl-histidine dipeptidase [Oscillospiraceae bacterium]